MYDKAHSQYNYLLSRLRPTDERYNEILKSHYYLLRSEKSFDRESYRFARIQVRLAQHHLWTVQFYYGGVKDKAAYNELIDLLKKIESYCETQIYD